MTDEKKKDPKKKPEQPKPAAPPSCAVCGLPSEKAGPLMQHPSGNHVCKGCVSGGARVFDQLEERMKDDKRAQDDLHNIIVGAYVTAAMVNAGPGAIAGPIMDGAINFADRALGLKPQIEDKGKG